jgi:predicted unusual protein kinase regulating ubiquinone biosynthesis (AarF/ABC1/UbiB family)
MSQVPEGPLKRARIAGTTAVQLGLGQLAQRAKRPFLSGEARQASDLALEERQARQLFDTLSQLRGTALKVAQMLCMEMELLPEAYRVELERACHRVPPLNRVLVRKVLLEAFGSTPETLFAEFDDRAFAAASLGQVHAATTHDGRRVAVKIQYPGIHVAIDSDIALMRQLARVMPNSELTLQSLDEIHARLREEVDYVREAENTCWFRQRLGDSQPRIPEVIPEYCGARVLTTSLVDGLHLDDWLATGPDQTARDRAGQALYDHFIHTARNLGCIHADPNPGNTLFAEDGTITLIDFGCVKRISSGFIECLPELLGAYLRDDPSALFQSYERLGIVIDHQSESLYEEILRPFGRWLVEPLRDEYYDFGEHPDYTARGLVVIYGLQRLKGLHGLADDFIFFDRTIYGLCKLFERMGARVRFRHHWLEERECTS